MPEELGFDYQQKQVSNISLFAAIHEEDMWQVCINFIGNFKFFTHIIILYGTSVHDNNCERRGHFSWYILPRNILHTSIFCINIPDVGLSQTETCSLFVTHWMKCTSSCCYRLLHTAPKNFTLPRTYAASVSACVKTSTTHSAACFDLYYVHKHRLYTSYLLHIL